MLNELLELYVKCEDVSVSKAPSFLGGKNSDHTLNIGFKMSGSNVCGCSAHYTTRQVSIVEYCELVNRLKFLAEKANTDLIILS